MSLGNRRGAKIVGQIMGGVKYLTFVVALLALEGSLLPFTLLSHGVHAQSAAPQDDLPEAPNKALVLSKCTQCHAAQIFSSHRQSATAWDETITKMQSKGLVLSDEEYDKVLGYLSTNLPPAPTLVNVNTASAADLQKGLDLTESEAAALLKARTAHGNFKDWHEVASVDGVDAKKIEAKKDLLSF